MVANPVIKAVVFDCDGLMFNTEEESLTCRAGSCCGAAARK